MVIAGDNVPKPPLKIHVINFIIKYLLFLLIYFTLNHFNIIIIEAIYVLLIPFMFTLIGVIADWTIVPKYHNIPGGIMGSIFMGTTTYLVVNYFGFGTITILSALILSLLLGTVEIVLHYYIVKPYIYSK